MFHVEVALRIIDC